MAAIALAGVATWLLIVIAMHAIKPELDPAYRYISEYAIGDTGWLMRAAFFAVATGAIAIAAGYRHALHPTRYAHLAVALTLVSALGFIAAGVFVTDPSDVADPTTTGVLHLVGALMALPTHALAALAYRGAFNHTEGWQPVAARIRWLPVLLLLAFLVSFFTPQGAAVGLAQRIFVAIVTAWLTFLALELRSRSTRA